jgi:hypothetical protein
VLYVLPINNICPFFFKLKKSFLIMLTEAEVLNLSNEALAQEIEAHQNRTEFLFTVMASRLTSGTKGLKNLGNDSVEIAEYWLKIALKYPKIIAEICNTTDFGIKAIFFRVLVSVADKDGTIANILKTPRNIASKDCYWYVSYIRKRVQELESDPIYKMILDKEPSPRVSISDTSQAQKAAEKAHKAAEKAQKAAEKAAEKAEFAMAKAAAKMAFKLPLPPLATPQ